MSRFSLYHDFAPKAPKQPHDPLRIGTTDSVLRPVSATLAELRAAKGYEYCDIHTPKTEPEPDIYAYARQVDAQDLLITGRFHSVCYALNTRTPFIGLESNTPKISSLLSDVFGSTRRVIKPSSLDTTDLGAFSSWSEEEALALDAFAQRRRESFALLFKAVGAVTQRSDSPLKAEA